MVTPKQFTGHAGVQPFTMFYTCSVRCEQVQKKMMMSQALLHLLADWCPKMIPIPRLDRIGIELRPS